MSEIPEPESKPETPTTRELQIWVDDARDLTLRLVQDLSDEQLMGPPLEIVNPLRWEIGHVAWFQELWSLRHARGQVSEIDHADELYNSSEVVHDTRWGLTLPDRQRTLAYLEGVRQRVHELLTGPDLSPRDRYFVMLSVFHEDMHTEAITYTRQTLAYPAPDLGVQETPVVPAAPNEDLAVAGRRFLLGSPRETGFVFDNEKWAHEVEVAPFAIARRPVTQGELAAFVEDGGYERAELWSPEGWRWREEQQATHPVYWRKDGGDWQRRVFDSWRPLETELPAIHVTWYEAQAWCRWAGRRLPTEAEWELTATGEPGSDRKRLFPWGDDPPTPARAQLDLRSLGCSSAGARSESASAVGCLGMVGDVWEWTSTTFEPYPGFRPDPYQDYSRPWFTTRKVLRGGCWATRSRMITSTHRNFFEPHRRDVFAGFRTCAVE